jgi:hypothetical protein
VEDKRETERNLVMKNGIVVSAIIVLLVGSSAIAQIAQSQVWDLSLANSMSLGGGVGSATASHWIGLFSPQSAGINPDPNGNPTVTADQGVAAGLYQEGSVDTNGAAVSLGQDLSIGSIPLSLLNQAGQVQEVGDLADPIVQYEGTEMEGTQDLEKGTGSIGTVSGLNLAGLGMGQAAVNTCGQGLQLSVMLGGQSSTLTGGAQGTGEVHMEMNGAVAQIQEINN